MALSDKEEDDLSDMEEDLSDTVDDTEEDLLWC